MPAMPRMGRLAIWVMCVLLFAACATRAPYWATVLPATPVPATAPRTPALAPGQRFTINQRVVSQDSALAKVALEVRAAHVEPNGLVLRIALVNISNDRFRLVGTIGGEDARLLDANGREYTPSVVEPTLRTLDPANGFAPGTANVGNVTFPLPQGDGPYEFRLPRYAPIRFELNTLQPESALVVADGKYPLDAVVYSQRDALRPIALRVHSLVIASNILTVSVGFANIGRQGYDLLVGPNGGDARVIDGEGTEYAPVSVSATISDSLAPEGGWQPQQENTGTISFPRPTDLSQLRFVFPDYDALTLTLDSQGITSSSITSASGGPPAPTATPSAEEMAISQIEAILAEQAAALRAGNPNAYAESFAPELQATQQTIAARFAQVPVVSYTLDLAPGATIGPGNTLANVPVELRYELRGIEPGNVFEHEIRVDFKRVGDRWLITRIDPGENPPFWWLGDVIVRETAHFLIFARPDAQDELATLASETEQAYQTLQTRGLPLESRYVTYFATKSEDFAALTGRSTGFLGVALARYEFLGDAINTTSRAFYINGATFRTVANGLAPEQRQTTITHELVHLALANQTRPFTPPWLVEGMAVYLSEDTGGTMRRRLIDDGRLPTLSLLALTQAGALGEHDTTGERASYEYAFAGETVAYLAQRYGETTVLDFYRSYAAVPAGDLTSQLPRYGGSVLADAAFAKLSASLTTEAVQRFFGVTLEQLDADVKTWLNGSP